MELGSCEACLIDGIFEYLVGNLWNSQTISAKNRLRELNYYYVLLCEGFLPNLCYFNLPVAVPTFLSDVFFSRAGNRLVDILNRTRKHNRLGPLETGRSRLVI